MLIEKQQRKYCGGFKCSSNENIVAASNAAGHRCNERTLHMVHFGMVPTSRAVQRAPRIITDFTS